MPYSRPASAGDTEVLPEPGLLLIELPDTAAVAQRPVIDLDDDAEQLPPELAWFG
jgi:hypothetical protein